MNLTSVKGLQSEIYVPITPVPVWAPVKKKLKDMTIVLATAAGVHLKSDKRFNLAGDTSYRIVPHNSGSKNLTVSHGGYDNGDVNKDINCMFPIDRLSELAAEGLRNIEIANKLFLSEHTVRAHLRSIYQKLDIDRRAKLAKIIK